VSAKISRREVVLGGAVLAGAAVSGCTVSVPSVPSVPLKGPDVVRRSGARQFAAIRADLVRRDAALLNELKLLQRCEATARRHRSLKATLRPLAGDHRAHVRALLGMSDAPVRRPKTARRVPADAGKALAELRRAERRAVEARVADCVAASSGELAALLAAIAASGAQHSSVLAAVP
jgi:hypothetical protein